MGCELAGLRRDDKRARACATRSERAGGCPRGATGCAFRFGTTEGGSGLRRRACGPVVFSVDQSQARVGGDGAVPVSRGGSNVAIRRYGDIDGAGQDGTNSVDSRRTSAKLLSFFPFCAEHSVAGKAEHPASEQRGASARTRPASCRPYIP